MSADTIPRLNAALEGHYRIESELGEGGMATVYLADDLKHERKVALKVLKPELAAVVGAERFLAEIKTTANLQHPHILPLHDSGEADGFLFYVMPYIEGESLRDRLDREKQLPVDDALRIASDVAEALHAAHQQGVIHRDIKPANILLSSGRPLVADFGIALAVSAAGGGRMTETGMSLGTPFYMSPEQASADREPSPASDVYSLGCVLYEMLVGDPPFVAGNAQAVLAKILTETAPSARAARASIPPHVDHALRKSLDKLPADRFATAEALAAALADPTFRVGGAAAESGASEDGPWKARALALAGIAAVASVLALWGWADRPSLPDAVPTRAELPGLDQTGAPGGGWRLAISPDGRTIVAGHREAVGEVPALYVRGAEELEWRPLEGTENATNPSVSPDGRWVVFNEGGNVEGAISKVPVAGGTRMQLADGITPHWGLTDEIVYMSGGGLYRVGPNGGAPELLHQFSDSVRPNRPHLLPNGKGVLLGTSTGGNPLNSRVLVLETETGVVRELLPSGSHPRFVATGHLVFAHGSGVIMAAPFDQGSLRVTGDPVVIVPDVRIGGGGAAQFAVSESGTLVYRIGEVDRGVGVLVEAWTDGRIDTLSTSAEAGMNRYSPDGSTLVHLASDGTLRMFDRATRTSRVFVSDFARATGPPAWSPDGRYLYFALEGLVYRRTTDFSRDAELLIEEAAPYRVVHDVSHGDSVLIVSEPGPSLDTQLRVVRQQNGGWVAADYLAGSAGAVSPSLSPDGRWIAYESYERGISRVSVRSFPVPGGAYPVSEDEAMKPVWSEDGRTIYFRSRSRIMAVDVSTEPTLAASAPWEVLDHPVFEPSIYSRGWDVHPDGTRLLFWEGGLVGDGQAREDQVILVTNWFAELRERMGEGN